MTANPLVLNKDSWLVGQSRSISSRRMINLATLFSVFSTENVTYFIDHDIEQALKISWTGCIYSKKSNPRKDTYQLFHLYQQFAYPVHLKNNDIISSFEITSSKNGFLQHTAKYG